MSKVKITSWKIMGIIVTPIIVLIIYVILHFTSIQHSEYSEKQQLISSRVVWGKILYMAASYSLDQYTALWNSLSSLVDICNAGWDISIHLQVSNGLDYDEILYSQIQNSLYCFYFDKNIPIFLHHYSHDIGFGLNSRHRGVIKDYLNEFDYFIYAEEDMVLTYSHFMAYIQAYEKIKLIYPRDYHSYSIGFLRYEDSMVSNERVSWEYEADKIHLARSPSNELYIVTNNMNQAISIFPRSQIIYLESVCDFLSTPGLNLFFRALRKALNKDWKYMSVGISEWSSSFQHVLQCGVYRVIPLAHYEQFFILHGTNKAQVRRKRDKLLNSTAWDSVLQSLQQSTARDQIRSIQDVYLDEIYSKQYNFHLLNFSSIEGKIRYRVNVRKEV